jgi:hypothetical protein
MYVMSIQGKNVAFENHPEMLLDFRKIPMSKQKAIQLAKAEQINSIEISQS